MNFDFPLSKHDSVDYEVVQFRAYWISQTELIMNIEQRVHRLWEKPQRGMNPLSLLILIESLIENLFSPPI